MKHLYVLLIVLCCHRGSAQTNNLVTAKVVNQQNGAALEFANIKILETNQFATSDKNGIFSIGGFEVNTNITIEISYIGFQKLTIPVRIRTGPTNLGLLELKELNLSLKNIDISAKKNFAGSTNSSLVITRDLIEQIPALSINDLLNLIPNRKITPPSLQNVQNLTLRSTFAETTSGRSEFELNNSFGIAIIMDGNVISNNSNMQSYNVGRTGMGGANITTGNSYGLRGAGTTSYSGDYAFGGTDLRQIPADNIESIEVISGVAPAKYGDLTDGAVIIERQAGVSPSSINLTIDFHFINFKN